MAWIGDGTGRLGLTLQHDSSMETSDRTSEGGMVRRRSREEMGTGVITEQQVSQSE